VSKAAKKFKRDLIPHVCEIPDCGYDIFITRHRIKAGRKKGKYLPGNVIGLCPNHHVEAELGLITQFQLFAIVQDRLKRTLKGKGNNGYIEWHGGLTSPEDSLTLVAYAPDKVSTNGATVRRD
jgi:hypothetical protein